MAAFVPFRCVLNIRRSPALRVKGRDIVWRTLVNQRGELAGRRQRSRRRFMPETANIEVKRPVSMPGPRQMTDRAPVKMPVADCSMTLPRVFGRLIKAASRFEETIMSSSRTKYQPSLFRRGEVIVLEMGDLASAAGLPARATDGRRGPGYQM